MHDCKIYFIIHGTYLFEEYKNHQPDYKQWSEHKKTHIDPTEGLNVNEKKKREWYQCYTDLSSSLFLFFRHAETGVEK